MCAEAISQLRWLCTLECVSRAPRSCQTPDSPARTESGEVKCSCHSNAYRALLRIYLRLIHPGGGCHILDTGATVPNKSADTISSVAEASSTVNACCESLAQKPFLLQCFIEALFAGITTCEDILYVSILCNLRLKRENLVAR